MFQVTEYILYFYDYKLAIEIDEMVIVTEILAKEAIEQELGCEFIRVNPDKKDFVNQLVI